MVSWFCVSAIELTVLCAFVCKVGYFDAQNKETLLSNLLVSLGICN